MRIDGSYSFPAPPERVLAVLADPDVLRSAIPGCERLIQLGPPAGDGTAAYEARLRLRDAIYIADMIVTPEPAAQRLCLHIEGHGPGGPFSGQGEFALTTRDGAAGDA